MKKFLLIAFGIFFATAVIGGFYLFAKRDAIINNLINRPDAINYVEQTASDLIGTQVKIGAFSLEDLNISSLINSALIINNIEVFDKNSELIAKVDKAEVTFKLLNFYDEGAGAIDEINIFDAQAFINRRSDDSWNVQDIKIKDTGESTFKAKINLHGGEVAANFDDKNISVNEIEATADCADMNAVATTLSAKTLGSQISASGTVGSEKQIINAIIDTVDISKIIPYIPADTLPENVEIRGGKATNTAINIFRRGELLSYSGFSNFENVAVRVEETEIHDITGSTTFTDAEYIINATAAANGQNVAASGKIRTDTDEIYIDMNADSNYFVPSAIIQNIGVDGAVGFTAHVFGTVKDPKVEAEISSNYLAYENISARNIRTNLRYVNNAVFLSNIYAETFGGSVRGEAELNAQSLTYNAHIKANGINIPTVANFAGANVPVYGNVNADLALNGKGADFSTLKVFGSANGNNISYQNFVVDNFDSSFYLNNDDIKIDYLNLNLPNNGTINLEGTVVDAKKLDFNFYAAHVDLALAKTFDPVIDVSGMSDFSGSIHGDIDNPNVALTLSAVGFPNHKAQLFKQDYDSLDLSVSGSFNAVNVELFEMEKDGKIEWQVMDGWLNLKERTLNVRLDTVGARLEGIVELLAPDQNLTGEIDNTIRVQGTFEKPELVGYVEMHYGSYNGILISSMRGDYFIEDGETFRLQDFEIITPMVDMVLNGTINIKDYAMDFVVRGREIDLKRFRKQFPYEVSGNAQFEGLIGGTVDAPKFDGQIKSDSLIFNNVELKNITGHIGATKKSLVLDDVQFTEDTGKYEMYLSADIDNGAMSGLATVENANIESMAALANYDAKFLSGKLTSNIEIGGTLKNPSVRLLGAITKGAVGNYDLHDVSVDVNFINWVANINELRGYQGEKGVFEVAGSANLHGNLDLLAKAENIENGVIGTAAGVDAEFVGTSNLHAKISGDINNPEGDFVLSATGGIKGSTFDLLRGHVTLKNWIFDVVEMTVERAVGEKVYKAAAKGTIPLEALYIENDNPSAQMNLQVSLDEADLSLLPVLSKMVAWATGEMDGTLNITGTAASPQINGKISLAEGTVKINGMQSLIEHINLSSEFQGEKFMIDDFSGNIGKGNFKLAGNLNFANFKINDYQVDFVADALDIQSNFFSGPLNANFSIYEETQRGRKLPKLMGNLDLEKCRLSIPSIPDSDDPLPEMILDVGINLGEKVHFYSSRLYNMFLTGNVKYEGTTLHPKPSGIISIKRGGTLNYISTVFDIREGELYFNQPDSFFPSVNFQADARVSNIKVNLSVMGTLNNMDLKLTSTPEKTQTEIMQILTLRDAYGNQTSNMTMADVLAIGLQMSILGDIEDVVKRTLGFDRFTFSSGSGSALDTFSNKEVNTGERKEEFNISVGKYVTDKLMLKYTQGINGERITRFGFQYDLNDNLGFTVEKEKGDYIFSLEARYKF